MPTDATETSANVADTPAAPVAKEAPTAQQQSQPGVPKKIVNAQTVCNEKNEKGKLCNGHLKQLRTGGEDAEKHLRGDDVLFKCQTCGTLYMGPPLGHVRDPQKQSRFVEKELTALLQAAGGTLPAIKKNEQGAYVLAEDHSHHAPAPTTAATPAKQPAQPAAATKPAAPAARPAAPSRTTTPTAASTSGTDSSAQADLHRPAAEAQAATGMASAAPMSPAAATASPAAGAETVADLAPDASTELTPGAPRDTTRPETLAPRSSTPTEGDKTEE